MGEINNQFISKAIKVDIKGNTRTLHIPNKDQSYSLLGIIDINKPIGKGSSGTVYACENPQSNRKCAVKIFTDHSRVKLQEARMNNKYYPCQEAQGIFQHNEDIYLIQTFHPGIDLFTPHHELNPELQKLTLLESLDLWLQISLCLNLFHHTRMTGGPIAHSDIKGANIRVKKKPKPGMPTTFDVAIIDFDLSEELADEDARSISKQGKGSPYYLPAYSLAGVRDTRADVYPMAAIGASILGAYNPFNLKAAKFREGATYKEVCQTPYDLTGLLNSEKFPEIENYSLPLKKYVEPFLKRIQSPDQCPHSDELLRFTTTLKNYYVAATTNQQSDLAIIYEAKLALMASNLWTVNHSNGLTAPHAKNPVTFERISLKRDQARKITAAFNEGTLTLETALTAVRPDCVNQQLIKLKEVGLNIDLLRFLEKISIYEPHIAIDILQKLDKFTLEEFQRLNSLTACLSKHAVLNSNSLEALITLNQKKVLEFCLTSYHQKRSNEKRDNWWGGEYFSLFGRYSRTEKLNTVNKINAWLQGNDEVFTQRDLAISRDHRLGALMEDFKKLGISLPTASEAQVTNTTQPLSIN